MAINYDIEYPKLQKRYQMVSAQAVRDCERAEAAETKLTRVADGIEDLIDKYLDPDGTLRIDESELLALLEQED